MKGKQSARTPLPMAGEGKARYTGIGWTTRTWNILSPLQSRVFFWTPTRQLFYELWVGYRTG